SGDGSPRSRRATRVSTRAWRPRTVFARVGFPGLIPATSGRDAIVRADPTPAAPGPRALWDAGLADRRTGRGRAAADRRRGGGRSDDAAAGCLADADGDAGRGGP